MIKSELFRFSKFINYFTPFFQGHDIYMYFMDFICLFQAFGFKFDHISIVYFRAVALDSVILTFHILFLLKFSQQSLDLQVYRVIITILIIHLVISC